MQGRGTIRWGKNINVKSKPIKKKVSKFRKKMKKKLHQNKDDYFLLKYLDMKSTKLLGKKGI